MTQLQDASVMGTEPVEPLAPAVQAWPELSLHTVGQALLVALPWWIGSRALALLGLAAAKAGWGTPGMLGPDTYAVWDVGWFIHISEDGYGYVDEETKAGAPAFMPLMPAVMRFGGLVLGDRPVLAGGAAANVGALIGAAALYHLVRMGLVRGHPGSHRAGVYAVAFLLASPLGLPLFLAYTESLFVAAAIPAWIAARRNMWWAAGLLSSVALLARVSGLFVAFGVGVMWLISRWPEGGSRRSWRSWRSWVLRSFHPNALWVFLPLLTYGAWTFRLYQLTGRWDAMSYAQSSMWNRRVVAPWEGFEGTIDEFDSVVGSVMRREMGATFAVFALVIVLVYRRAWPEAAFVGSACYVLMSSSIWGSSIRAFTIFFPFWILVGLGAAAISRRRNGTSWVMVALALSGLALFWCELLIANGAVVL